VTGTYGWLGAGDLEPDRLVANLTEADRLPTDIWMTDHVSTQPPYAAPSTPEDNEGRKQRWNR
jgi:hypothetical protein